MENRRKKSEPSQYRMMEIGQCSNCGGLVRDGGFGIHICTQCGRETLSDFGKVKKFINEHGPANAFVISQNTGVHMDKIDKFLREGRIEIPEGSDRYISCTMCGADIRYGRYCPQCASKIKKENMTGFLLSEVGETPKKRGKMRYMSSDDDKKTKKRF